MEENKEIDISKTIMNTIKLLEEKLEDIKKVDEQKHGEMREELDNIYEASKNKRLNVFETVNQLMQLQNETIAFLDTALEKKQAECTDLQIYTEPKKGFWERLFEKFINKISSLKKHSAKLEFEKH